MGQALSSASSNVAQVKRAVTVGAVPTATVLIDLDNTAFNQQGEMDYECLTRRLNVIARTFHRASNVKMFCNKATMAFIKKHNFKYLKNVVSTGDNDGDSADHALLRCYVALTRNKKKSSVAIVTYDKTLARLATYMRPPGCTLRFAIFRGACDAASVFDESRYPLSFPSAEELDKFMKSLALFHKRSASPSRQGPACSPDARKR